MNKDYLKKEMIFSKLVYISKVNKNKRKYKIK